MSLKLQNTDINALDLYTGDINKAYLGSTLVYGSEVAASGIYDNASVVYSLRRPDMATKWTNAVLRLRRSSDNATADVFLLNHSSPSVGDTVTLSSQISTTSPTTPDATLLSAWVGSNDAYVVRIYGITPDNTIDDNKRLNETTTSLQPKFISNGVILTKNGKADIDFSASTSIRLRGDANASLDSGNDFTIFTVSYSNSSTNFNAVLSTKLASGGTNSRLAVHNDRKTDRRLAIIRNTTATDFEVLYDVQQDNANQRLQTLVMASGTMEGFLNGVSQDSIAVTGTYVNDDLVMGIERGANGLDGGVQEAIIFPSDKTADLTALHADINAYYTIYV